MDNQVEDASVGLAHTHNANYQSTKPRPAFFEINQTLDVPKYLDESYWWAYLHPKGVSFFDKPAIVNGILFGNYHRLRDTVVNSIQQRPGNVLQLAAVYGNISPKIAEAVQPTHNLDVVDVAPIQLQNLSHKVTGMNNVYLHHQDAGDLDMNGETYDYVVLFFLLHEVPDELKGKILAQAFRHLKPGGKLIIVDYHKPVAHSPMRYLMYPILSQLEPYALSMWKNEVQKWFPSGYDITSMNKQTFFGGLYQHIEVTL